MEFKEIKCFLIQNFLNTIYNKMQEIQLKIKTLKKNKFLNFQKN